MRIAIYRRGKVWHYRGTIDGRRIRGTTRLEDKEKALQFVSQLEERIWQSRQHGPEAVLTFAQAAIYYRKAGKPTRFLDKIEDYWKDTPVRQITRGAIRQSALVIYKNVSGATRNRQVIVPTCAIINHAAEMDLCQTIRVKRFPVTRRIKEPATWEWIQAFMANASPHLGALACFMFATGARISEAIDLRWEDVDLNGNRALIRQTKIGAERMAHLPPVLVAAIANIESNREPSEKVFRYSSRFTADPVWENAIKRAKIKRLTFHSCRHGFATAMLHKGVDPITVAKLGGWKSPAHVFATYGHAMDDKTLSERIFDTPLAQAETAERKRSIG